MATAKFFLEVFHARKPGILTLVQLLALVFTGGSTTSRVFYALRGE